MNWANNPSQWVKSCQAIFFWLVCSSYVFAQLDNKVFEENLAIRPERKQSLYLYVQNFAFVKNNEYFNAGIQGKTLFGYQLAPSLVYYPTQNVRIQAGVMAMKDFGAEGFTQLLPLFSVKIQKDCTSITLGNLQGALAHRLIEPLFDFERNITNRYENGLQILWHRRRVFADVWVDWQQQASIANQTQEQIFGGLHTYYRPIDKPNFYFQLPFQFTIRHRGGQIGGSRQPLTNAVNYAVGLSAAWAFGEGSWLQKINADNYWVGSLNTAVDSTEVAKNEAGGAIYTNLTVTTRTLQMMLSYWQALSYFESAQGGELYRSFLLQAPAGQFGLFPRNRNILILRLFKDVKVMDDLWLSFRFEPYFDFTNGLIEQAAGIYVNYRPYAKLLKVKAKQPD